ncbi:hypothetical protein BJ742DRAFT_52107 [Cladochytrium replicatum]|nr:hypothetical protein BJ742DRAFT_52107 [Cladochytrium replicatum]
MMYKTYSCGISLTSLDKRHMIANTLSNPSDPVEPSMVNTSSVILFSPSIIVTYSVLLEQPHPQSSVGQFRQCSLSLALFLLYFIHYSNIFCISVRRKMGFESNMLVAERSTC